HGSPPPHDCRSFPTRRSSDLVRNLKHLIPTIENYMVPLLFRSEKLSEELSAASLCKGLSVERNRSCCTEVKLTLADFLYLLGMADRKSTRLNSSHVSISYAVF